MKKPVQPSPAKGKPLPAADPDLVHVVHMGPNLDRIFHLRPEDLKTWTRSQNPQR